MIIKKKFKILGYAIAALIFVFLGVYVGAYGADLKHQAQLRKEINEKELLHGEISKERIKNKSLEESLHSLSDENLQLSDLIVSLHESINNVEYIEIVRTIIKGEETQEFENLPEQHIFKLDQGLAVAEFKRDESSFIFETFDLNFVNSIVIGKNATTSLLQIASSYEPEKFYEIKIDEFQVTRVKDRKIFEPNLGIGITASFEPTPDILGSMYISFFHPNENLDLLAVRASFNKESFKIGLDPAGYNLGQVLPVVTDLWIYGGLGIEPSLNTSFDFSIATKF